MSRHDDSARYRLACRMARVISTVLTLTVVTRSSKSITFSL